jgi:hypothetical protein
MSTNMNADTDPRESEPNGTSSYPDAPDAVSNDPSILDVALASQGLLTSERERERGRLTAAMEPLALDQVAASSRLELFEAPSVAIELSCVSSVQCYSSTSPRQKQGICQVFLRSGSSPTIDLKLSRALIRAVVEHYAAQFCAGGPGIQLFETPSGVIVLADVVLVQLSSPQDGSCQVFLRSGASSMIDGQFGVDLIRALKGHLAFHGSGSRGPA